MHRPLSLSLSLSVFTELEDLLVLGSLHQVGTIDGQDLVTRLQLATL